MKKMSFTNSMWSSLLQRATVLALVVFCFTGLQTTASAQIVADEDRTAQLSSCSGEVTSASTLFTDDGANDGNYADPLGAPRTVTVEILPADAWSRVQVVFNKFDLAPGDELAVFQGNAAAVTAGLLPAATATGTGVSLAFGGWVDADCDPAINPSGALTFVFTTNGDNIKGAGWDAWVDCVARDIVLNEPNISNATLACADASAMVTIPAATISAAAGCVISDSVQVVISDQHGNACITGKLSASAAGFPASMVNVFALGTYKATYTLCSDPSKTVSSFFSVQAPALVCNDDIVVPLGSACAITLTPDDILEQPCAAIPGVLDYNITITLGSGKDAVTLPTPVITSAAIAAAGMTPCDATATVKIERTYYSAGIPVGIDCDNGVAVASCETVISFSDQSIPFVAINANVDTIVACDASSLADLITATAFDNCATIDPANIAMEIVMDETDPCFSANGTPNETTATVTFTATDDCGNVGTKSQVFTVLRPDENNPDHIALTEDVQADCSESSAASGVPGLRTGTIKNGVFTASDTVALSTNDYICGYILTKNSVDIPATDCGVKQFISFAVLDWCSPESGPSAIDTTFIEFTDTKAPTFDAGTGANQNIELGHFSCTYDISNIAIPTASDNCDENPSVRLDGVFRIEDGGLWLLSAEEAAQLDCDSFHLRWIAEDACHEQIVNDTLYQTIVIQDVTDPSAVAVDQLNISIPNEYGARVNVADIDAGSYDACGIKSMGIRIAGSGADFADFVDVGCQFVHPDLQIELQVIDNKGNSNLAWTDILVEDKIAPICDDLPAQTRLCTEFHNGELGASTDADGDREFEASEWTAVPADLQAVFDREFGAFQCEDNLKTAVCGDLTTVEEYQLIEWPCGEIEILRRHRSEDWSGNVSPYATQSITVEYEAGWSFTVPNDWEGQCGDNVVAPEITVDNGACDLLGFEVTSRLFEIPGDACFKMERTYHIINWCTYTAGQAPVEIARIEGEHSFATGQTITSVGNEDVGYFTYVQILRVHDDEGPIVTVTEPDPCINGIDFDAPPHGEEDVTPGTAPFECDEVKTWTATAVDCSDNSAITWTAVLRDANGNVVAETNEPSISIVVTNKSTFTAEFWAFDGCGNSTGSTGNAIKFWDCKKPTPYLLNGVAVELGENGIVQVWATDLDQGTFDNCTDQSKLDLRIYHESLGAAPTDLAGVEGLPKVLDLGCSTLGQQNVQIYAVDEEGNFDFAQTYVIVQDNMGVCGGSAGGMVAGRIVDGNGENVESVSVAVNGADDKTMTTAADGYYQFELPMGGDYTVTPEKDMNPLNGVSTFDLVLISKHILGLTPFDTPYKYIAADVNKSGTITAFDMVQLRQLILNITSEYPNNDSWRFVEGGYEFTSANPAAESFNEFLSINNLADDMPNLDFTAVKIGDVNGSALANNLLGAESRSTNGTLNLNVADRFVEAGQSVTVEFTSDNIASATGYQFTLTTAGTAEVVEGVAKAANFNTNLAERGVIATSWNGEATASDVLFAITFTANTTGLLSEMVAVTSDVTAAEAYNTNGELLNVDINFSAATTAGFGLNQNTPNPFNAETVIGFNLPTAGAATLKVLDVQGKVLRAITADYAKGYNTVSLNASELGATGVLYYQLESADNVATKKMIIID